MAQLVTAKEGRGAVAASHIASQQLPKTPGGLLVLTGAAGVLGESGTDFMVGYGLAKAATHQLVASMARGGEMHAVGVLPDVIDTPNNRAAMPDADHASWASTSDMAEMIVGWASGGLEARPPNGSLVMVETEGGRTGQGAAVSITGRPMFRFDVGAEVEAFIGEGWAPGVVVGLSYREDPWPEGQYVPYQVSYTALVPSLSSRRASSPPPFPFSDPADKWFVHLRAA